MRRFFAVIMLSALFSLVLACTAFAGTWKMGEGANAGRWWYDRGDGTYPVNTWEWIDGNGDHIAECYCFDGNGWLYVDTVTPDGYSVNYNGAWNDQGATRTDWVDQAYSSKPFVSYDSQNGYNVPAEEEMHGKYDASIPMPVYLDYNMFNSSSTKQISMRCDTGCKMYYTTGMNPPDPTEDDKQYKNMVYFGWTYGTPSLQPGDTLKIIAVRTEDGAVSGMTTLNYTDAHAGNKGRSGNISSSSASNPNAGNNWNNSSNSGSQSGSSATSRLCPVCSGKGSVTCTYCHGTGQGTNASIGLGGDVWKGDCPGCGGSGKKTCAGCSGSGYLH